MTFRVQSTDPLWPETQAELLMSQAELNINNYSSLSAAFPAKRQMLGSCMFNKFSGMCPNSTGAETYYELKKFPSRHVLRHQILSDMIFLKVQLQDVCCFTETSILGVCFPHCVSSLLGRDCFPNKVM